MAVTVFAEITEIVVEAETPGAPLPEGSQPQARAGMRGSRGPATPGTRTEGETAEGEWGQPLGPSDIVPIEYSAVPGTTTNVPGAHAYPGPGVAQLMASPATVVKVKLAEPHSGSFELHISNVPASTLTVGQCRLTLAEA